MYASYTKQHTTTTHTAQAAKDAARSSREHTRTVNVPVRRAGDSPP